TVFSVYSHFSFRFIVYIIYCEINLSIFKVVDFQNWTSRLVKGFFLLNLTRSIKLLSRLSWDSFLEDTIFSYFSIRMIRDQFTFFVSFFVIASPLRRSIWIIQFIESIQNTFRIIY